jgi:acetylglutamate/LysW-gamma-L-alpha-aminoadipate kinase
MGMNEKTAGVVKIGGAKGNDPLSLLVDLAAKAAAGEQWLLVHGASGYMEDICLASGLEPQYVESPGGFRSRFMGEQEKDLFEFACSRFSVDLISTAAGLGLWIVPVYPDQKPVALGKRKDVLRIVENGRVRLRRGNQSGKVTGFVPEKIRNIWSMGALPMIPPMAWSLEDGFAVNVDGDRLAAAAAGALEADVLVILSNVPGLLVDPSDRSSLIKEGCLQEWEEMEQYAKGNMKRKLLAAREALEQQVGKVVIADSREDHPLERALSGGGTTICP